MAFAAQDFFNLANWLVQTKPDEAGFRTAISRMYYACHLLAVQKLHEKGWQPKGTGDDHGRVLQELRQRRYRNLSERLYRLRELREHADYHVNAAASVLNDHCEFCKRVRESMLSVDPVTTLDHRQEAREVSEALLPLLDKL